MTSEQTHPTPGSLPELGCACATIRRTARLVTRFYGEQMGQELEPAQFSLLSALSRRPGASQATLGRALGLDKTTLSRNLRLMQRNEWIELAPAHDQRERGYRLTRAGNKLYASTEAGWSRAQNKLRAALQPGEWEAILKVFDRVAEATRIAQEDLTASKVKHAPAQESPEKSSAGSI